MKIATIILALLLAQTPLLFVTHRNSQTQHAIADIQKQMATTISTMSAITDQQRHVTNTLIHQEQQIETAQASAALFGYESARNGLSREQFAWQARQMFPNATIWTNSIHP